MDSRDIKENPTKDQFLLEDMFILQKQLLEHYIKIESIPNYPINVNKKTNQFLLKDLTARVIEELAEGYESLLQVWEITQKNKLWSQDYNPDDYTAMLNHLQNFGEELSDALHFFIELLIYINIEPEDIIKYIKTSEEVIKGDLLEALLLIGHVMVVNEYEEEFPKAHNILPLIDPRNPEANVNYHVAGSNISKDGLELQKKLLWDVTYHLNISRNFLKNKPWKQSEEMTAETQYQTQVMKAFMALMGYLKFVGCDQQIVYFLYFKKNKVNQFRIKSNY